MAVSGDRNSSSWQNFCDEAFGLPVDRPRLIVSAQYNDWPSPFEPDEPSRSSPTPNLAPWINRIQFS